tara:strand:+ start:2137 stop:2862 length:726 start_codon:yes stop_codon:yes gene_type:complete
MDYKAPENIYWLFSSSAQSVSAFIALLITGFAFVQTIMDGLQQKDETLEEIHNKLKKEYYTKIILLSIATGLAIILSLLMVFLNGYCFRNKTLLLIFTALLNVIAIGGGIMFVIYIINPNRYKKVAEKLIEADKTEFSQTGNEVDQMTFTKEFISLEKLIREKLISKKLYVPYGDSPKMVYSFRQMIQALFQNELIDRQNYDDLLQINKFRNLVFHGHVNSVDKGMVDRVQSALNMVRKIK